MITNGWAYLIAFAPLNLPSWVTWLARTYIGIIYLPTTPEKLITFPIAIWVHVRLFKYDHKTKHQLEDMHEQAKQDWITVKTKLKEKKTLIKSLLFFI